MENKTTTIYKNAILNKATDVLQIFIKYIIVIISMLFLGFIFLQSFFGSTLLDFCESSFFSNEFITHDPLESFVNSPTSVVL